VLRPQAPRCSSRVQRMDGSSVAVDQLQAGALTFEEGSGSPVIDNEWRAAESVDGANESMCAPAGVYCRRGARDPRTPSPAWRPPLVWDAPAANGDKSELARQLAEGQGIIGDTRILILDDSTLSRDYLAGVITAHGAHAPSVAWDLSSLIAAIENAMPRVILLNVATRDYAMLLRHSLKLSPNVRVIVLGMSEDDESDIVACAEAGVVGYHMRNDSLEDLLLLVRRVAAGESSCSPRVSAILLRRLSALAAARQPISKELGLTVREVEILKMLEFGLSNRDIAAELCIAIHTVKNHVHSVLIKLGVSTRAEAAALARTSWYTENGR
jgi:DNA-binding NarL/FixJ family response regulator